MEQQYKYNCIQGGGEYHGYVFAEGGETVFEVHYPMFHYDEDLGEKIEELTLFDLGIMKNTLDVLGLQNHLIKLGKIAPDAVVVMDSQKADKGAVIESITGGVHSAVNPVVGYADGGDVTTEKDPLQTKIEAILKEELPNFYTFVRKRKNFFAETYYLQIGMAASNYEINRVNGQYPQYVSLMLDLSDMDLRTQVFGGNGGDRIYLIPDKNDPKEKYLAMAGRRIPFRKPKPMEKNILDAIRRFAQNYRNTLVENRDRLMYQDVVNYDEVLGLGSSMKYGGLSYMEGGEITEYQGTKAYTVNFKTYRNFPAAWRVIFFWGNTKPFVEVTKVTNNPFGGRLGKDFDTLDKAIAHYKSPEMKVLLLQAGDVAKKAGVPMDMFAVGGKTKNFKDMTFKEKSASVQAKLRGSKVPPKYRKKYGKTYDSKEAKEAADAITGKIVSKMKK